jgi:HK97 family phage prohead protease
MSKVIPKTVQKEIRAFTSKIELRSIGEGDNKQEVIEGYALKFNTWSEELGSYVQFKETIKPNALDGCNMSDVRCLFNHDSNKPLGRNTISEGIGSLTLSVDNIGLKFRCIPTQTSYANDLKENIRSGVVNQCSFAFTLGDNKEADSIEYNDKDSIYERTINQFECISDVSVVTYPAYSDTEAVVGQRCKDKIEELKQQRDNMQSIDNIEDLECVCENCSHSDNCQSSGAKCCICSNCSMVSQCSKPGTNNCRCYDCILATDNCCQTGSDSCLCSTCDNTNCKKGHMTNQIEMNSKEQECELRKKLILKTYI